MLAILSRNSRPQKHLLTSFVPFFTGKNSTRILCNVVILLHKVIALEDALKIEKPLFIDMRSPGEYEQGHIPGAINIPLFNDHERAEVGTIYKQVGVIEAKQRGLAIVSSKLPELVNQIRSFYQTGYSIIIYCWRGGMRSKSVVTVLDLMGITAYQLIGGYKAYRRFVLDRLRTFELRPEIIVICGSTGVGKTALLGKLAEKQVPVIDLESLANHRGSVFGQVGLGKPQTAQNFDALLLQELQRLNEKRYVVVECESKRIGNVYLPDVLYQAMRRGKKILVQADLETRVSRLIAEYVDVYRNNTEALLVSLKTLAKRLGTRKVTALSDKLLRGEVRDVVRILLTDYYDPLYGYETANPDHFDLVVDANNLVQAACQIVEYLEQRR